jgi:hypothetical protein
LESSTAAKYAVWQTRTRPGEPSFREGPASVGQVQASRLKEMVMKHGKRLPVAFAALLLLTVAVSPASATEVGDDDGCQGLTTALSKVKNERARTAIQANLDTRGCEDEGQTAQSACETLPGGTFFDKPGKFGSGAPGIVDWGCQFRPNEDITTQAGSDFLRPFCASGYAISHVNEFGGPTWFECLL